MKLNIACILGDMVNFIEDKINIKLIPNTFHSDCWFSMRMPLSKIKKIENKENLLSWQYCRQSWTTGVINSSKLFVKDMLLQEVITEPQMFCLRVWLDTPEKYLSYWFKLLYRWNQTQVPYDLFPVSPEQVTYVIWQQIANLQSLCS